MTEKEKEEKVRKFNKNSAFFGWIAIGATVIGAFGIDWRVGAFVVAGWAIILSLGFSSLEKDLKKKGCRGDCR